MSNERRSELSKALELIQQAASIIEQARDEEQEYYDNMPESLQSGEKGAAASEAVYYLTAAFDNLLDATNDVEISRGGY